MAPQKLGGSQQFARGQAVDVLIVGAGVTGCMAAATLARYGISFRIIDKSPQRVQVGQAAGIQPRTLEILRSLGLFHIFESKGSHVIETAFWSRDEGSELVCTWRGPEFTLPTPFKNCLHCHQGHTEAIFADDLASRGIAVDRPYRFINHKKTEDGRFPLIVRLKDEVSGVVTEVPSKNILGCDGAGSAVRDNLGIQSDIEDTPNTWAVADTYLATNFPDIRRRCLIRTDQGSIMSIGSTSNGVRTYTLLSTEDVENLEHSKYQTGAPSDESEETLIGIVSQRVKAILKPYKIDIHSIEWVSMYHVTQRVVKSFADPDDRVFILGDACHTHSAKAGQGMNVSFNDSSNLTWKLALHIRGIAKPELLKSYETERRYIAKQLIEFDHKFSSLLASSDNHHTSDLHDYWVEGKAFTTGLGHRYPLSLLVKNDVGVAIDQQALEPLTPGKRLYPISLTRHIDGGQTNLLDAMPSNGKFHIFVFAGTNKVLHDDRTNIIHNSSKHSTDSDPLATAAEFLASPTSPLNRYTPNAHAKANSNSFDAFHDLSTDLDRVVGLFLVHREDHLKLAVADLPAPFPDWAPRVFEDVDGKNRRELGLGDQGALVIVRPDGYVGLLASLMGSEEVGAYCEGLLCG